MVKFLKFIIPFSTYVIGVTLCLIYGGWQLTVGVCLIAVAYRLANRLSKL